MSESLLKELSEFAQKKQDNNLFDACKKSEYQTRMSLVNPYIGLLGFDPSDPTEVRFEYGTTTLHSPDKVDYALMFGDRPIVFVEAKSLGHRSVSNSEQMNKQLRSYMLDSQTATFGALTDGQRWRWYYQEPDRVDPVLFLDVDVLADSQNNDIVEWAQQLRERASVGNLLITARTLSQASKIRKWFFDSIEKPTDNLAKMLRKEIGETGQKRSQLEQCKRSWQRAMQDLSTNRRIVRSEPQQPVPPQPDPPDPVAKYVLKYSDDQEESFSNATRLLLGVVSYCAISHGNGRDDYYKRINKPISGSGSSNACISEEEFTALDNPTKNYSSMSECGYHVFRNINTDRKVIFIRALLEECILISGDKPQIGRDIQIHLANSSLKIPNFEPKS